MAAPIRTNVVATWMLVVGLVGAGCLESKETGQSPGKTPDVAGVSLPNLTMASGILIASEKVATEPSIAVAPDGTFWVAGPTGFVTPAASGNPEPYTHDSGLWSSKDHGKTWTFNAPIPGYGRDLCPGGGDSDLSISPDGTLYLVDLYLGNVVVVVSSDGGKTWLCNPYTSAAPGDDRQWVEVYKNEAVYVMFNQIPAGAIVLKATRAGAAQADGLVYTQQTPVGASSNGNFVVDQEDGTIYLAANGNTIQVSTDGGKTFQGKRTTLPSGLSDFRAVTLDAKGVVYVVAAVQSKGIVVASSKDKGATWSPAATLSPMPGEYRFPWAAAHGDGILNVAWYGKPSTAPAGGDGYYLYAARAWNATNNLTNSSFTVTQVTQKPVLTQDICMGLGCGPGRALGDFFEITTDKDGNLLIPYNEATPTAKLLFAQETAATASAPTSGNGTRPS